MRLFNQAFLSISLVALFSFGGAWIARDVIVKPYLAELEAITDRKDLRRVLLAIDGKQQQLVALAYDRATTNRSGDELAASNDSDNPLVETFITLNLSYFGLFNTELEPVKWLELDLPQSSFVPSSLPIADLQPYLTRNLARGTTPAPIFSSGWMRTQRGPVLYALATTNQRSVLIASTVDREFLHDISESMQLNVHITSLADAGIPTTSIDSVRRDANDEIHWLLRDSLNQPAARLTLKMPPHTQIAHLASTPLVVAFLIAAVCGIFLLFAVERTLILPIRSLGQHLHRIRELGDYSLRTPQNRRNELGQLSRELNALVEQVQTQQLQLIAQSRELQALSYQDSLTTLANRRRFDQALADNWAMAQRQRKPLALIMCDVDYFKAYNDHYGHQKGDEILRQLAHIIAAVVTRTSDLATRYGGEEFAILLPDTTESGATHLALELQHRLQEANIPHEHSAICRRLTLSIGVASIMPESGQGPRDLVRLADEALYAAKANGRNRIETATDLL